ncbi:MAG: hypothetical protein WC620_02640 [Methanoregula sp.]|jgi:hypothetical protein
MDNELILTVAFLGAGLLAYVIIPGLLVIWDRVLDHMENSEQKKTVTAGEKSPANIFSFANPVAHNTTFFSLTQINMCK